MTDEVRRSGPKVILGAMISMTVGKLGVRSVFVLYTLPRRTKRSSPIKPLQLSRLAHMIELDKLLRKVSSIGKETNPLQANPVFYATLI